MFRDETGWIQAYTNKGAYWEHDGNPLRPHALLTSGNHSGGFFNSRLVISDDKLLREAASDLIDLFFVKCVHIEDYVFVYPDVYPNQVIGPQTGATKLAEFISDEVQRRGKKCGWASPSKAGEGTHKQMIFEDAHRVPEQGERILLCEDVITTGGSVDLTIRAIKDLAPASRVSELVLTLVNRSGNLRIHKWKPVGLINRHLPIWTPDECPLCRQGSKAIRPKDPYAWEQLNANY